MSKCLKKFNKFLWYLGFSYPEKNSLLEIDINFCFHKGLSKYTTNFFYVICGTYDCEVNAMKTSLSEENFIKEGFSVSNHKKMSQSAFDMIYYLIHQLNIKIGWKGHLCCYNVKTVSSAGEIVEWYKNWLLKYWDMNKRGFFSLWAQLLQEENMKNYIKISLICSFTHPQTFIFNH